MIVSLRYARKICQVFGWIAIYIIKKKTQTLKQISHCRPTSLSKLVCLPCFSLPLGQNKVSACQRKLWLLEEPTHEKQTWEFWWLAFHSSLKNLPKLLEQHYPLVLCFVAACMCLERQIKCHLCHCSRRAVGSFCGWDGAQVGVTWPGRGRSDELSPGLPHVLSRCQHRTAQVPPAACLGHGSLWPSSTALCGRTGISAPLSARFVFLISFYLKVYQLLYYQAELSLQFLPLSSSFSFFVPQDNHCVWSQLPLLIFHYSLI